jgi:hypothetical protein
VRTSIIARQAFTLVEGELPSELYKGRIDAEDLVAKVVRHDQSTLSLEQVDFFVVHNGRLLNEGKKLSLFPITPYPGLESPAVHAIPAELPLDNGQMVSTNENSSKENGRLILHTSMENMPIAYKNLKPRWQITYRTRHQMIGSKPVGELAPATPGAVFIYGTVELPALEPAYVEHGRRRPKDGPLVEAVDRYLTEKIRELAHQINARRKKELDEQALDQVHEENRKLDAFKNRFLPNFGDGDGASGTGNGAGPRIGGGGGGTEWGTEPDALEYSIPEGGLHLGRGITVALRTMLETRVRDVNGRPVRAVIEWHTSDARVAAVLREDLLTGQDKGTCEVWGRVRGTAIESARIPVRIWNVDHVLLTPRNLDIALGTRQQIVAEVTDDEGRRSTNVLLDWSYDAEDPLIVRVSLNGVVTGNRLGRTAITAGAGGVLARIPTEVTVIPNPQEKKRGSGFPRLLLTGRDLDPATGTVREGDPDQPALWQEASDFVHNVWWLNLQSPEAAFIFHQRGMAPTLWRTYHAEKVIEMVIQVWMTDEFTRKGESERPDFWAAHLSATDRHRVRTVQQMWARLEPYISSGAAWTEGETRVQQ